MAHYQIETVPMPRSMPWARRPNPITATLLELEVGQSIKVPDGDPFWRISLVTNMNQHHKPRHWFKVTEADGHRIYRDA